MLRAFGISFTDGHGLRIKERVLAFDTSSAVRAFKYVRPEATDIKCEEEPGEPADALSA